jgi:predicted ATPase
MLNNQRNEKQVNQKEYTYLAQWRLQNFKSVRNATIDLAPLTVLVGPNSAGKSSLIQSILLFAQNARRTMRDFDSNYRGQVILNGDLVELGTIEETRCDNPITSSREIGIGATFIGGKNRGLLSRNPKYDPRKNTNNATLKWDLSLVNEPGLENSGTAIVGNVCSIFKAPEGETETLKVKFTNGNHMTGVSQLEDAKFSDKYSGTLEYKDRAPNSLNIPQASNPDAEFLAINFGAGIPMDGLKFITRAQAIWDQQVQHFSTFGFLIDDLVARYLSCEAAEKISTKDDAIVACLDWLEKQLVSEEKPGSKRKFSTASFSMYMNGSEPPIPLHAIPWKALQDFAVNYPELLGKIDPNYTSTPDLTELVQPEILDALDSALDLEMREFWLDVSARAKVQFLSVPGAFEREWVGGDRFRARTLEASVFQAAQTWSQYLATGVLYLEPLREAPKANYSFSSGGAISPQIPIGSKGEHLAQRLYDRTPAIFPLPDNLENKKRMPLIDAVNLWLKVLRIEGPIKVEPQGRSGFLLTVGGRVLPMLGTGISQVLPVLTLCLIARRGDLILLEQPELHLNPSMQQLLADFLLEIAKTDRQIIVETHSEYLVTRLRLKNLEGSEMSDLSKILFVEKDPVRGTEYREVVVNEFGEIQDWPKGFFDQASSDYKKLIMKIAEKKELEALNQQK